MSVVIKCCVRNLQQFQYGEILEELAGDHEVSLDRCQNQCVGCRKQPAFTIDGQWLSVEDPLIIKAYVNNHLMNKKE